MDTKICPKCGKQTIESKWRLDPKLSTEELYINSDLNVDGEFQTELEALKIIKRNTPICYWCEAELPMPNPEATKTPTPKRKALTGFEEIKEKGGIVVYDPESYPSIVDKVLTEIYPDYKKEIQSVNGILNEAVRLFKSEDTEWEKFGEPAKNVERFGYPEDDYDEGIYYHIHNKETLLLKGEGNTFRILSEEDQKRYDNFWVLNSDIRKQQDKIKNLVVFGDDTGIRARLFKDFENLETVHLYGYVKSIRKEAFWNCPIKYLGLSEDIDTIVEDAFMGAKFKYLIFPVFTSLDDFECQDHSFVDCKELKYVLISEYLYDYFDGDLDDCFEDCFKDCFKGCDKLNTQNVWRVDANLKIKRLLTNKEEISKPAATKTPTPKPKAAKPTASEPRKEAVQTPPKPIQSTSERKKGKRQTLFIYLGIMLVILISAFFGVFSNSSKEEANESEIKGIEKVYSGSSDAESNSSDWNEIDKRLKDLKSPSEFIKSNSGMDGSELRSEAYDQYKSIKDDAYNIYKSIKDDAYNIYKKLKDSAYDKYKSIKDEAYDKYQDGNLEYSEYDEIQSKAYSEYDKIQSKAYSEYDEIQSSAYEKYDDIQSKAYSWYDEISSMTYEKNL